MVINCQILFRNKQRPATTQHEIQAADGKSQHFERLETKALRNGREIEEMNISIIGKIDLNYFKYCRLH